MSEPIDWSSMSLDEILTEYKRLCAELDICSACRDTGLVRNHRGEMRPALASPITATRDPDGLWVFLEGDVGPCTACGLYVDEDAL